MFISLKINYVFSSNLFYYERFMFISDKQIHLENCKKNHSFKSRNMNSSVYLYYRCMSVTNLVDLIYYM